MSLFATKQIYCAYCGKQFETIFSTWFSSLAKVRVCGRECLDAIDKVYVRCIMNKPEPNEKEQPSDDQT